jgi:apolipoprotein D and lipocalin family protein
MNLLNRSFLIIGMLLIGSKKSPSQELTVVDSVDLARYAGRWYEIARLPNRFQNDCTGNVTATYTVLPNGEIQVVNRCSKEGGDSAVAEGRARRADDDGPNTKLKVRFAPAILSFLPFVWGDYWILDLGPGYSYVVIGEPKREYLWVLARTPSLEEETLVQILDRVKKQGYALTGLIRTSQSAAGSR